MNLSDTFYIALCMTVLILGVVYWFWTQNQYIQRKMNLLENIVYEMKTSLQGNTPAMLPEPVHYQPAPSSVLGEDEDLEHEALLSEVEGPGEEMTATATANTAPVVTNASPTTMHVNDEPLIEVQRKSPSAKSDAVPEALRPGAPTLEIDVDNSKASVLENMTLKELRRLADQRGVQGSATMRKQALIDVIRMKPPSITPFDMGEATLDLSD